jgi:hypothetical protein
MIALLARIIAADTRCPQALAERVAALLVRYASALTVRVDVAHAHVTRRRSAAIVVRLMRENYEAAARQAERLVTPPASLTAKWLADVMEEIDHV